jgi:hypothetical protein
MTDKQINAAIAEACGKVPTIYGEWYPPVPEYCTDLNAMHVAESVLTIIEQDEYWNFLWDVTGSKFELCHATARQRAEAFLRTLGKWEEGE